MCADSKAPRYAAASWRLLGGAIIESIIEIKQILQMNGSQTWLGGNWSQHEVSLIFFSDFLIVLQ